MKRPRVILADDHTLILDALKNLLEPEFEVVDMFADGRALLEGAASLNPNVIVLDISMPGMMSRTERSVTRVSPATLSRSGWMRARRHAAT